MKHLTSILNDERFHIEFNGHLTHHGKQAAIALAGLGHSDDDVISYYENYCRQTPYGMGLEPRCDRATKQLLHDEILPLLGQRRRFTDLYNFFLDDINRAGLRETVARYIHCLLPGWVGSLTHPVIQLGFALEAQNKIMAAEGLAYWVFSYVPAHPKRLDLGHVGGATPLDTFLAKLKSFEAEGVDQEIETLVTDQSPEAADKILPELMRSGLQYRLARLCREGHSILYGAPSWFGKSDWRQMFEFVTTVYLAKPGNFLLLHLLTSLHAFEVTSSVDSKSAEFLRHFWIGALIVLFGGGQTPRTNDLLAVTKRFGQKVDNPADPTFEIFWSKLATQALHDPEEHNGKLVYVMKKEWERTGYRTLYRMAAAQFTQTPVLAFHDRAEIEQEVV